MYIPGAGEFRVSWVEGVYLVALAVNVLLGLGGGMPWGDIFRVRGVGATVPRGNIYSKLIVSLNDTEVT